MISSSLSLTERDAQVVWHPFSPVHYAPPNIGLVRGEGARLYDTEGRVYIDAVASWWTNLFGHAHPHLVRAVHEQAGQLEHAIFANFTHEPAVRLAERLLDILPENQARVFYSDNGSTSVEVALKMALQYWHNLGTPRTRIVALEGAYHGDTFGAMAVGARNGFSAPFAPLLFDVSFIPSPSQVSAEELLAHLERELSTGDVAAIIVEPLVQGSGGMLMYSAETLEMLYAHARQHGVLIIADEVMTGFGRTGKPFASLHATTRPDIFCLSKGLTAGFMPLGATTCTDAIYQTFNTPDRLKTLFHGHSFTANPLGCAVANAALDLFLDPTTTANIARIESAHRKFALELLALHGSEGSATYRPENIRIHGVIFALDVAATTVATTSYFNPLATVLWQFFIARGLLLRPLGNTIYILPPYCITDEELEAVYTGIKTFFL